MMIALGCVAAFFFVVDFATAILKAKRFDIDGTRWDGIEAAIYFTAMVICFK